MKNVNIHAGLSVLIVDDDPFLSEIVTHVLHETGLTSITCVQDGRLALEQLAEDSFDLLICDLNMPDIDGVRLMRDMSTSSSPPAIILFSGEDLRILDASKQYAEAQKLVVLGVLRKPLVPEALIDILLRYQPVRERHHHYGAAVRLEGENIRKGFDTGFLRLAHQPKIDLRTGQLIGVESLLRWHDEQLGLVSAHEVIRVAEKEKIIDVLTRNILVEAARDRARLRAAGIDVGVSINVSMHNLLDPSIVDYMSDVVRTTGDLPSRYTIEVTETHLVRDLALVLETLIRARLRGFQVAIDDYGTGAASMQLLMQLPSTELKIDRTFTSMACRHELGRALFKSAVDIGLQLGQIVTAEGIEDHAQAQMAKDLGCHQGQGFFYGHPMTVDALVAWSRFRNELTS